MNELTEEAIKEAIGPEAAALLEAKPETEAKETPDNVPDETKDETQDSEEEIEQAKAQGWKPEGIPGKRNKSAKEFLEIGSYRDKVISISKENKELKLQVQKIAKFLNGLETESLEAAKQKVRQELNDDVAMGKIRASDAFGQYETKIKEIETTQKPTFLNETVVPGPTPQAQAFVDKYKDILMDGSGKDPLNLEIQRYVLTEDNALFKLNLPIEEAVSQLEQKMLRRFPEKFANKGATKPKTEPKGDAARVDELSVGELDLEAKKMIDFFGTQGVDRKVLLTLYANQKGAK